MHFRKLFCIYEKNVWYTPVKEFCFSVYHTQLVIFVSVRNAPLLKCLTSVSVNHLLETQNKTKLKTENKIVYSLYMYATLTTLAVVWALWSFRIFIWSELYWWALKEWNNCWTAVYRWTADYRWGVDTFFHICHMTSFNYDAKEARDLGLSCRCHLSNSQIVSSV